MCLQSDDKQEASTSARDFDTTFYIEEVGFYP